MSAITEAFRALKQSVVSVQKTPGRLFSLDDFPRTLTGKILKTELRKRVRGFQASPAPPAAEERA